MKLISWNVNGLRACMGKGFLDFFHAQDADIFCLQETKLQPNQIALDLPGYQQFWNSAEKKGYSGTAIFCKEQPLSVSYDLHDPVHTGEGRAITLEFSSFYMLNLYVPNAQRELKRIDYRMQWEDAVRAYVGMLAGQKPVILCGDLNVAHNEIDLKNPKTNRGNAGFSDEERQKMAELLQSGMVDTFRMLYPDRQGAYTWWSYMFKARQNNAGWRIDYFLVSEALKARVQDSVIYSDVMGSDHCPIGLVMDL